MVNISIDVTDLGGEARPGDKVVLWKPAAAGSATHAGRVISTAPVDVFLTDGKATVPDVEPGDMRVLLQCRGVESQGPIPVVVPDSTGTVTLRSLIEAQFEYSPPVVSAVQQAADNAAASERAAIQAQVRSENAADRAEARVDEAINNGANLVRNEVKQDADRAVAAKNDAQAAQSAAESSADAAENDRREVASDREAVEGYRAEVTAAHGETLAARDTAVGAAETATQQADRAASEADRAASDRWLKNTTVTSSQSVDEVKVPGQYPVNDAQGLPEKASQKLGVLEVLQSHGSPIQRFTTWGKTEEVWVRSWSSSQSMWFGWTKQPTRQDSISYGGRVTDLNEVRTPGVYFFADDSHAPETMTSKLGVLEVLPSLNAVVQRIVTWSMEEPQVWVRSWQQSRERWAEWSLVGEVSSPSEMASGAGEPGLKTVPLAVSTGRGGENPNASGTYRYLMHWGAPVTRWRVHISNVHPQYGASRGDFTLRYVELRKGESIDDLNPERVDVLLQGSTVIKAGKEYVSQWRTDDLTVPHFLQLKVDGANFYRMESPSWKHDGAGYVPSTSTAPLWIWVEAETYSWTPVVALLGDSTGAGSGATLPVYDSTVSIEGRRLGFLPVHYAHSGDTLGGNVNADDPNYTRWAGRGFATADSVVIQAGSNDIHNKGSLEEVQQRFIDVAQAVKQISPVVLGSTIKPHYPVDESVEDIRKAYNEWMRTQQPGGVRGYVDFDKAVAPQGTIREEFAYDQGHLTTAGHEEMAKAFQSVTVARPSLNRLLKEV